MNGGTTTETIALLAGSLAIDAIPQASCTYPGSLNPCTTSGSGNQLTCDQRGKPRPDPEDGSGGNCDIGAYEYQPPKAAALQVNKTADNVTVSARRSDRLHDQRDGFRRGGGRHWRNHQRHAADQFRAELDDG